MTVGRVVSGASTRGRLFPSILLHKRTISEEKKASLETVLRGTDEEGLFFLQRKLFKNNYEIGSLGFTGAIIRIFTFQPISRTI